jgi:hypothetical protein
MLALPLMATNPGSVHFNLVCHPQTLLLSARSVEVVVQVSADGALTARYLLTGDLSALRIPEYHSAQRVDGLWRHTCFEAFVMAGEGPEYYEFNFSPSGEWAAYSFQSYRKAGEPVVWKEPAIRVRRSADRLELAVEFHADFPSGCRSLRLGLSAVVEQADGGLSYWALRHPPGRPDFHHLDAFALPLDLT